MQSNIPVNKEEPVGATPKKTRNGKKRFRLEKKWNSDEKPFFADSYKWSGFGRYEKYEDAEKAMNHYMRDSWYCKYEWRIVEV